MDADVRETVSLRGRQGAAWQSLWASRTGFLLAFSTLLLLFAFQQFGGIGRADLFGRTLSNALHVPLFAVTALLVDRLLRRPHPTWVLVICIGIAALSELLQIFNARDASLGDIGRDLMGAAPVVAGLMLSRHNRASGRLDTPALWAGVALTVALLTAAAPARVMLAYQSRDAAFPVLFDPASCAQRVLLSSNSVVRVVPGNAGNGFSSPQVLEVVWNDERYPHLTVSEVVPDWSDYQVLVAEVRVPGDTPMPLTAAVGYLGREGTAAALSRTLQPGFQQVRYPLPAFSRGRKPLEPRISKLLLHSRQTMAGRHLELGRVWLEKHPSS